MNYEIGIQWLAVMSVGCIGMVCVAAGMYVLCPSIRAEIRADFKR